LNAFGFQIPRSAAEPEPKFADVLFVKRVDLIHQPDGRAEEQDHGTMG
jgi:hypothetical protein